MLGASLSASPLWAQTPESDVQQRLRDYEERLEQLEKQETRVVLFSTIDRPLID